MATGFSAAGCETGLLVVAVGSAFGVEAIEGVDALSAEEVGVWDCAWVEPVSPLLVDVPAPALDVEVDAGVGLVAATGEVLEDGVLLPALLALALEPVLEEGVELVGSADRTDAVEAPDVDPAWDAEAGGLEAGVCGEESELGLGVVVPRALNRSEPAPGTTVLSATAPPTVAAVFSPADNLFQPSWIVFPSFVRFSVVVFVNEDNPAQASSKDSFCFFSSAFLAKMRSSSSLSSSDI